MKEINNSGKMYKALFKYKLPIFEALSVYGFTKADNAYNYSTNICNGEFSFLINVSDDGSVHTSVFENETGEEYIPYRTNAAGGFVGGIRHECELIVRDIIKKCYRTEIFKSEQTKSLLARAEEVYGDLPEFLWEKTPDCAILRRKDTKKWYAVIMTIAKHKLGLKSDEIVEIINLRVKRENMPDLVDNQRFFGGWHMNKKTWCSVVLDGTVSIEELFCRMVDSYELAVK